MRTKELSRMRLSSFVEKGCFLLPLKCVRVLFYNKVKKRGIHKKKQIFQLTFG